MAKETSQEIQEIIQYIQQYNTLLTPQSKESLSHIVKTIQNGTFKELSAEHAQEIIRHFNELQGKWKLKLFEEQYIRKMLTTKTRELLIQEIETCRKELEGLKTKHKNRSTYITKIRKNIEKQTAPNTKENQGKVYQLQQDIEILLTEKTKKEHHLKELEKALGQLISKSTQTEQKMEAPLLSEEDVITMAADALFQERMSMHYGEYGIPLSYFIDKDKEQLASLQVKLEKAATKTEKETILHKQKIRQKVIDHLENEQKTPFWKLQKETPITDVKKEVASKDLVPPPTTIKKEIPSPPSVPPPLQKKLPPTPQKGIFKTIGSFFKSIGRGLSAIGRGLRSLFRK